MYGSKGITVYAAGNHVCILLVTLANSRKQPRDEAAIEVLDVTMLPI